MGRAHEVRAASMAKTAAIKSKLYSRFGKELYIAAKSGVPDPDMNLSLKRKMLLREQSTKRRVEHTKTIQKHAMKDLVLVTLLSL